MISFTLRPDLPKLPDRMRDLPVNEAGYPVPWFIAWLDGKPDFRCIDPMKFKRAIRDRRCWICGEPLGVHVSFLIGPMCAVNRVSSEPPSHRDCAEFAVRACPFLTRPAAERRQENLPAAALPAAGFAILRNPGVSLIWTTRSYQVIGDGHGGALLRVGDPTDCTWWAEGRTATRDEVMHSIETGLPTLKAAAESDGPEASYALGKMVGRALMMVPE